MKNYLKNLKTELESRAPQMSNEVKQTTIVTQPKRKSPLASMFSSWQRVAAFCVALVLVVGVGVLGTTHLTNNGYQANATYMSVSINPSFSLVLDSNDKVVKVVATNYDGEVVLSPETASQVQGKSAQDAVSILVDGSYSMGYVGNGTVNVTFASSQRDAKTQKLMDSVKQSVAQVAQNYNLDTAVQVAKQSAEQLKQVAQGYFANAQGTMQELLNQMSQVPSYLQQLEAQVTTQYETAVKQYALHSKATQLEGFVSTVQQRNNLLQANYDTIVDICEQIRLAALMELVFEDPIELLSSPTRNTLSGEQLKALLSSLEQSLEPLVQAGISIDRSTDLPLLKINYGMADQMFEMLQQVQEELSNQGQFVAEVLEGYVAEVYNWVCQLMQDAQGVFDQIDSFISSATPQDFAQSVKDKVNQDRIERAPQGSQQGEPKGKV